MTSEKTQVWSCGGGTQSIAIAALIVQGKLPKPDWAIIVDTEREKDTTWQYYNDILKPELKTVGVELHRVKKSDYATVDLMSTNDQHILLPMFTTATENGVGKFSNFCSYEWKRRVIQRFLRTNGIADECIWIGFSVDESRRFLRMQKSQDYQDGKVRFPLIFDHPMRRQHCVDMVKQMGWPPPPRSACYMCPNQGDDEWRETKENRPDEFQEAVDLERFLQEKDPHVFFHKSCVPLDQVGFGNDFGLFSERHCGSGMCFV